MLDAMRDGRMPGGRGWVLYGGTGCGKTARARLAADYCGIRIRSADAIVGEFAGSDGGNGALEDAGRLGLCPHTHRDPGSDLIIDDLGREVREVVMYGTRRDPMREILERRLDEWPRIRTYITTNLAEDELERRYGERVASRLAGSCVLVAMPQMDWRRAEAEKYGWGRR